MSEDLKPLTKAWFTPAEGETFSYEQREWKLINHKVDELLHVFEYEDAAPDITSPSVAVLILIWREKSPSFDDTYHEVSKSSEARVLDGVEWAARIAEAHEAPRVVVEAIRGSVGKLKRLMAKP